MTIRPRDMTEIENMRERHAVRAAERLVEDQWHSAPRGLTVDSLEAKAWRAAARFGPDLGIRANTEQYHFATSEGNIVRRSVRREVSLTEDLRMWAQKHWRAQGDDFSFSLISLGPV